MRHTYTNIHANSHTDADRNLDAYSYAHSNAAASSESRAERDASRLCAAATRAVGNSRSAVVGRELWLSLIADATAVRSILR